jgi:alternate signal-mediated exported protein
MAKKKTTRKVANAAIACTVGVTLLVGGSTYALWTSNAPAKTQATITDGDLQVTAASQQKWTDITKAEAPFVIDQLADFRMSPGDTLRLKQDLNVIIVGDNISGVLEVRLPNDTVSKEVLSQAVLTLAVLDKSGTVVGSVTPTANTADSLQLALPKLKQTVATGEKYTVQVTVALPNTADNAIKNQVILLGNTAITLRQGAPLPTPTVEPAPTTPTPEPTPIAVDPLLEVPAKPSEVTPVMNTSDSRYIIETYKLSDRYIEYRYNKADKSIYSYRTLRLSDNKPKTFEDAPSTTIYNNGKISLQSWSNGVSPDRPLNRSQPVSISYDTETGVRIAEWWYANGWPSRDPAAGPAHITRYPSGQLKTEEYITYTFNANVLTNPYDYANTAYTEAGVATLKEYWLNGNRYSTKAAWVAAGGGKTKPVVAK